MQLRYRFAGKTSPGSDFHSGRLDQKRETTRGENEEEEEEEEKRNRE